MVEASDNWVLGELPFDSDSGSEEDGERANLTAAIAATKLDASPAPTSTSIAAATADFSPAAATPAIHEDALPRPPQRLCSHDCGYRVERIHFSELSVADFRRRTAMSPNPIIITGLAEHMLPVGEGGLSAAVLRELLPARLIIPVRGRGTTPAAQFFELLEAGEHVYLADVPLARHFPWLFQRVRVPRYFLHCFSHRTRRRLSIALDTPALFVGAKATRSALHVDQMCSNFWMFLAEGEKHWTTFHPDDTQLLKPAFDEPEQIDRFQPLEVLEADPGARRSFAARRAKLTRRGVPQMLRLLCRTLVESLLLRSRASVCTAQIRESGRRGGSTSPSRRASSSSSHITRPTR